MKIEDIVTESSPETQMRKSKIDFLLKRIEDTDDPTELKRLNAKLETYLAAKDQEGGVVQDMDQADEINSIAVAKDSNSDNEVVQLEPIVVQGLKPEDRLGARLGRWLNKKFTTDPIADKTQAALALRNAKAVAKQTKGDSALDYDDAGYEKYDNPADASTIADLEKADYDSEMAQWNADNKKKSASKKDNSQAILNTEKSKRDQAQKRAQRQKQKELARMKANAGMKDDDYKTSPGSKRTAQDLALDKEYTYKADDGRRLKYKQGDIRNAFHSSPDSRKAGSDKVIRGDRVGKRLVDKEPVRRTNQDDRAK
jgi:hypothetical protein